jgi:hypothetical protein
VIRGREIIHEQLRALENELVILCPSTHLHGLRDETGIALGERPGQHRLACNDIRKILLLLRVRPIAGDG